MFDRVPIIVAPTFRGYFCAPARHSIPYTKPCTKFDISSLSSFEDMFDRMPKIMGSRDIGHAHF